MNELNIHSRLKSARKYLGLNQLSVADDLKIKQKTVSEIENGKIMNIPNTYIYYFYQKGISLEWLYSGKGEMLKSTGQNTIAGEEPNSFELLSNSVVTEPSKITHEENKEPVQNSEKYINLILNAKDENIRSLANYIQAQERMILFLQEIIRKELKMEIKKQPE